MASAESQTPMATFKFLLSWLVPVKVSCSEPRFSFRGQEWVPWTHYSACMEANARLVVQKTALQAQLGEAEARRETAEARLKHRMQTNVVLQANLEKAEAKFEAACIVNHLQRQKQTAYERSVYAASMGGMILDNQEEIARIAEQARKAIREIGPG